MSMLYKLLRVKEMLINFNIPGICNFHPVCSYEHMDEWDMDYGKNVLNLQAEQVELEFIDDITVIVSCKGRNTHAHTHTHTYSCQPQ